MRGVGCFGLYKRVTWRKVTTSKCKFSIYTIFTIAARMCSTLRRLTPLKQTEGREGAAT